MTRRRRLSAALLGTPAKASAVALLGAAVRGLVRIEETGGDRKPDDAVRVFDPSSILVSGGGGGGA
ncbi:hypothetical protein C5E08_14505 [Rathayibacter iranicus]|uniref:Uncharacterized protein n=1 Tax=Rathayibacter iranicus TaxID=59737 RepID=A0AAD1AGU0_9MICO|nr:hypothetical protein C7V51_14750 [Rathayibacter iranicus]MWV29603.1 hypothetical protein [Rathayibacter iranicus NCPPB 2253 = VKM Ac-1602]PPI41919.1 hypothetical protein C5E09_13605 [Rathayibacter iranicus]PPI57659.1 hypothetical protein C5E08_14505 [Rathayibacter iranicus]PPI68639.1 hypothetical protein C5E01_13560 [Rathayibacter iranicus]